MPGDLKGRIVTLKSMCEILQRLERWQAVYEHLRLIWAIELELGSTRNAERTEQQLHEFQKLHADQLSLMRTHSFTIHRRTVAATHLPGSVRFERGLPLVSAI